MPHIAQRRELIEISADGFLLLQHLCETVDNHDAFLQRRCCHKLCEAHIQFFCLLSDCRIVAFAKTHRNQLRLVFRCNGTSLSAGLTCRYSSCFFRGFGVHPDKPFVIRPPRGGGCIYKQYACLSPTEIVFCRASLFRLLLCVFFHATGNKKSRPPLSVQTSGFERQSGQDVVWTVFGFG